MDPVFLTCMVIVYFFTKSKVDSVAYRNGKEPPGVAKARIRHEAGGGARTASGKPKGPGAFRLMLASRWANACKAVQQRGDHQARRRRAWYDETAPHRDAAWRKKQLKRLEKKNAAHAQWAIDHGLIDLSEVRERKAEDEAWRENARRDTEAGTTDGTGRQPVRSGFYVQVPQPGQGPADEPSEQPSGYSTLTPEQCQLVDDWMRANTAGESITMTPADYFGLPEDVRADMVADAWRVGFRPGGKVNGQVVPIGQWDPDAVRVLGERGITEPPACPAFLEQGKSCRECGSEYVTHCGDAGYFCHFCWLKNYWGYGGAGSSATDPGQKADGTGTPDESGSDESQPAAVDTGPAPASAAGPDQSTEADHTGQPTQAAESEEISANPIPNTGTEGNTVYEQAATRLIAAADQVAEYRDELSAFADTLAGKNWGVEVTGPIQDMDGQLVALEGEYRDLAGQMQHQGGQGDDAYDQAPWVPGPEAVLA